MRRINVGRQKSGEIYHHEIEERKAKSKRYAKKHRKTERLVYVGGCKNTYTGINPEETPDEAAARYRSKHRDEFSNETYSIIPTKYQK